jgi:hypothetical protein
VANSLFALSNRKSGRFLEEKYRENLSNLFIAVAGRLEILFDGLSDCSVFTIE